MLGRSRDGTEVIIEVHPSLVGLLCLKSVQVQLFHVSCLCENELVVGRQ